MQFLSNYSIWSNTGYFHKQKQILKYQTFLWSGNSLFLASYIPRPSLIRFFICFFNLIDSTEYLQKIILWRLKIKRGSVIDIALKR